MPVDEELELPICPACGLEYQVDEEGEEPQEYECTQCGIIGFDCCIAGRNVICGDCEAQALEDDTEDEDEIY